VIQGVIVVDRRQIVDERGKIMHMLRRDDPEFLSFGEVYFSWVNPGAIKAWHRHRDMTLNYVCPYGQVKLALYDDRPTSPTNGIVQEIFLGPDSYRLVQIPPMVWNGFKCIAQHPSMVCNCATIPHDPTEIERANPFDESFPYNWNLNSG
jgi:dTDP-4-dehydrorhamnose 3,5-epimerase